MALVDFRYLDPSVPIEADVCIVGSGPAGWTLAEDLADSGLRIVVLESGGAADSGGCGRVPELDDLNATEDVGAPLFNGRMRTLGGTPEIVPWGNRCIAFDDIDYAARPWVPHSGWPFGHDEIAPWLDRASRHLGAGPYLPGGPDVPPAPAGVSPPAVDPDRLINVTWSYGRDGGDTVRYARLFRQRPKDSIRVIVHATVTHLNTNAAGDHIESVEIADPEGLRATVVASTVVLCAGGIENARILLYSNRQMPAGVGNAHGLVGRFLMDHPRDLEQTVTIDARWSDAFHRLFGPFFVDTGDGDREFVGGLALSPELQRREELLNTVAWPVTDRLDNDPIFAAQRLKRLNRSSLRSDLGAVAKYPATTLKGLYASAVRKAPARSVYKRIGFFIGSEQTPNPDSRVTLSDRVDRLGLPLARTDWRISAQDRRSQAVLATTIAAEFARLGLPEARPSEWTREGHHDEAKLSDGCHPTGTTRIASDPRGGVVDANCQVHGVDGLFVAGSSVFPTAGHANPTLMIVALAARLAAHIRERRVGAAPLRAASQLVGAAS